MADADATTTAPPRAFAQGTGVLLQVIGGILFLSTCCVCSLSGLWDPNLSRGEVTELLEREPDIIAAPRGWLDEPGKSGLMMLVVFSTVGGLALAGFGLGLQSEAPRAALGALIANSLLLVALIVAGVGLWIGQTGVAVRLWHALVLLVCAVLMGFVVAAFVQVRRHPPPAGWHSLPPDFDARDVMAGEKPSRMKIAELRARLEIEQRELERLERELHSKDTDPT